MAETRTYQTSLTAGVPYTFRIELGSVPATVSMSYNGQSILSNKVITSTVYEVQAYTPASSNGEITWTYEGSAGTVRIMEAQPSYYNVSERDSKTIAFCEGRDFWGSFYSFIPEAMAYAGTDLVSFRNGSLYIHDREDRINNFYGIDYPARVAYPLNEGGAVVVLDNISVESAIRPTYVHFRTDDGQYVQSTDITESEFSTLENIHYAEIKADRLSPNVSGSFDEKMLSGDAMRGKFPKVMIEFDNNTQNISLDSVNVYYTLSRGHNQ